MDTNDTLHKYLELAAQRRAQAQERDIPCNIWRFARRRGEASTVRDLTVHIVDIPDWSDFASLTVSVAENWLHGSCAVRITIGHTIVFEAEGLLDINSYLSESPFDTPPTFCDANIRIYRPDIEWEEVVQEWNKYPDAPMRLNEPIEDTYLGNRIKSDWSELPKSA